MRVAMTTDVVTNSLVVSGPPDAVEEVRKLAEALDQPQPRVEFELELGEVDAGEATHGENIKSEDSSRHAETQGTFVVLERPKTMKTIARVRVFALDNQPANIRSGQRVATIAGVTRLGGFGGGRGGSDAAANTAPKPSYSYTYQDVGTLVALTPRINAKDGAVVVQVDAEDSRIRPTAVDVGQEFHPAETDTLTLQTTVTIPDGKTIMLGSIGRQGKGDKELVIVITPHIIHAEGGKRTGP
jgi:type II secretory pathway component GspD/PulD (secretin)